MTPWQWRFYVTDDALRHVSASAIHTLDEYGSHYPQTPGRRVQTIQQRYGVTGGPVLWYSLDFYLANGWLQLCSVRLSYRRTLTEIPDTPASQQRFLPNGWMSGPLVLWLSNHSITILVLTCWLTFTYCPHHYTSHRATPVNMVLFEAVI